MSQLQAQKITEQTIENESVSSIIIEGDHIFKISVKASKRKSFSLQSKIEGEYSKDLAVSSQIRNDTLLISTDFQPFFKTDNNHKLSAHKVISIEVILRIPENLDVYIKSAIASAEIEGKYKFLTLELSQGNAFITSFNGDAIVNSINGNVSIETNNALVEAVSKTGTVKQEELNSGNQININTITGNISVIKTKK